MTKTANEYSNGVPSVKLFVTGDDVTVTVTGGDDGGSEIEVDGIGEEFADEVGSAETDADDEDDDEDGDTCVLSDEGEGSTVTPRLIDALSATGEMIPA